MFNDPRFKVNHSIDKFGRRKKGAQDEHLLKLYRVEAEGEDAAAETLTDQKKKQLSTKVTNIPPTEAVPSDSDSNSDKAGANTGLEAAKVAESDSASDQADDAEELADDVSVSSSGSFLESLDEEEEEVGGENRPWSPPKTMIEEGEETHRLAVMGLDWSRVKAVDILAALQSFVPSNSFVRSVTIYPSEFGLEQQALEERYGPQGIWSDTEGAQSTGDEAEKPKKANTGRGRGSRAETAAAFDAEKLRKYELGKLRWYYAIADCDSVQTAMALYEACDGIEFLRTSNFMDLRFVPDTQEFTRPPREVAVEVPSNYKPPEFVTQALQQTRIELTWEGEDPDREALISAPGSKPALPFSEYEKYLASDDEDQQSKAKAATTTAPSKTASEPQGGKLKKKKRKKDREKYLALLGSIQASEMGSDNDEGQELEVTFTPGLTEAAQKMVSKKLAQKEQGELNVWEQYQQKRKEKKKERRKAKKELASSGAESDVSVGAGAEGANGRAEKPRKTEEEKEKEKEAKRKEEDRQKAELELLFADGDADKAKKGFKTKEIAKHKQSAKRKGRHEGPGEAELHSGFDVDTSDPRFSALFSSHVYAVDPTHPQFKHTPAMMKILKERQNKRHVAVEAPSDPPKASSTGMKAPDSDLTSLVKRIKANSKR